MQHLPLYKDYEIAMVNVRESGFYRESPEVLTKMNQVIYSKVDADWLLKTDNKDKVAISFKLSLSRP